MSYILDALKRADAERERGAVPGLHAQPAEMPLPDEPRASRMPPWAWGLGGLGLALLGMLAWSMWRGEAVPAAPGPQPAPQGAAAPSQRGLAGSWPRAALPPETSPDERPDERVDARANAAPAGRAARQTRQTDTASPPRASHGATDPRAPLHAARGRGERRPPDGTRDERDAQDARPAATARGDHATSGPPGGHAPERSAAQADTDRAIARPGTATAAATAVQQPATASPAGRVYALHELPDSVRRSLPTLVIGGAMYSDNPASRMLVVNTQLFHEGDKLGPDLTLEEIRLKSAVLRYKGYRYSVTY